MKTAYKHYRGFTLIEMLIVIGIMMIMIAAAATMMQPASESRRTREAGRMVNVYLSSARNRAIQLKRPCGVVFRNFATTGAAGFAMTAEQCEVPPCYCGDSVASAATLRWTTVTRSGGSTELKLIATLDAVLPTKMVKPGKYVGTTFVPGDFIQFNSQGLFYYIDATDETTTPKINPVDSDGYLTDKAVTLRVDSSQLMPWTTAASRPLPYRIYRFPVKAGAAPLQLPTASVVDLDYSGCASVGVVGQQDFAVVFSPTGAVDSVYYAAGRNLVSDPIYLLVGKRGRVAAPFIANNSNETTLTNFQDLNNVWVTVNPQTGAVATEPVAVSTSTTKATAINQSRSLAAQGQGMGGK